MRCGSALCALAVAAALAVSPLAGTAAAMGDGFRPGSPSAGDPYFPGDGNGGYDVQHYDLALAYRPATDRLEGTATITVKATQDLSRFNLDLSGLTVRSVRVEGTKAVWRHRGDELVVTPAQGIRDGRTFTTVVTYDGVPKPLTEFGGISGFIHTDDGALVVGQPHVADTWFPSNDHPSDKASFRFAVRVPKGLTAVANGELQSRRTSGAWTTWVWDAREPMATYLATASVGDFELNAYRHGDIRMWDAVDPDLYAPVAAPHTGNQLAWSGSADSAYNRLSRTIQVPAGGATLSFWVTPATEPGWDYFLVEAHPVGSDEWTTLPDENGHTSQDTGNSCPFWLSIHPFLAHYQTEAPSGGCDPRGSTGTWNATTGGGGPEQWVIDLSPYAGTDLEVSLSYVSDDVVALPGVFVDDVSLSSGPGSTSFEADGDTLDGWVVGGPPAGSPGNTSAWAAVGAADVPVGPGELIDAAFARQGEVLDFLAGMFGDYPFSSSGGIVDQLLELGFALENQTRPIYSQGFFTDSESAISVIVHELAHQWYGDSLALKRWKDIWLNEGFATYAEWLWSEDQGADTAQQLFDFWYNDIPADDEFWQLTIGDPGPDRLFDFPVYIRGAMTLHQLRNTVGDAAFFQILKTWAHQHEGGNVTTPQFIALAERTSGQQLDTLFDAWLYTPGLPDVTSAAASAQASGAATEPSGQGSAGAPAVTGPPRLPRR